MNVVKIEGGLKTQSKCRAIYGGIFLLALAFIFCSPAARAQIDSGAITGTLRDDQGAVLSGASVAIRNIATGVTSTTKTNTDGTYQVLALIPGTYSVEARAAGFGAAKTTGVEIHVQTRAQIDFTLHVGTVQSQVEVQADTVQLQTNSADVGTVIGANQINDLPLNSRRYADLALLSPGVFKNPSVANSAPDRFSSNGNLETQNYFALDGVDNNSGSTNLQEGSVQNVQPPPDAIQEFRLQTRTYSTEFGASAGAVINASVKSGTNEFHGNVWEYARNSIFDANTFLNRQNGIPKGTFSQNQFGGTLGGPIYRNRMFFFGDYQGLRSAQQVTKLSVVPSHNMKNGDFSELDPSVYPFLSLATGQAGCLNAATRIIAPSCLDPVGMKLGALYPDPNLPGATVWTGNPNYQFVYNSPTQVNSADGRLDFKISERDSVFGRYSYLKQHRQDPPWTSNPIAGNGGFATDYNIRNQGLALGWTHIFSASAVNQARFGFSRDNAVSGPIGLTLGKSNAGDFGLTGIPASAFTAGIPPMYISGLVTLGVDRFRPQFQVAQVFQFIDTFTKLQG
ncbi:MAG: carboxypeptidase-like regulatory domain-containing protein, partial [Edaphobacter sp.]